MPTCSQHQCLVAEPNITFGDHCSAVNTNVSVPLTNWQLEVRMHWVEPMPLSHATTSPATIHEYFRAYPLRTKLYSVGLMCSPRWALMWAWVFERDTALKLLHQHIVHHQVCSADAQQLKQHVAT